MVGARRRGRSDEDSTGTLIERAACGESGALGELWRRYNPVVLRYLGGRGVADPADVAAQVWLEVVRRFDDFEGGEEELRRWLLTTARWRVQDEYRRVGRRPEEPLVETMAPVVHPDGRVEDLDWALGLVRRLAPDQADAVLLRVVASMGADEAALVLGKSSGAIRVLTHRGLERLRVLLARDATDESEGASGRNPPEGVTQSRAATVEEVR